MNKEDVIKHASVYQREVYRFAGELVSKHKLKTMLDVGCGYPKKLEEFILPITKDIIGVDCKEIIEIVKEDIKWGEWLSCNFEKESVDIDRKIDLIICADVIDIIMEQLKRKFYEKYSSIQTNTIRNFINTVDWSNRFIGIKGSRGVGKTTLILQYIKQYYKPDKIGRASCRERV